MAELGISCPTGGTATDTSVDVDRLSLVRTGDSFLANTALDINSPGAGWASEGGPVFISSASAFLDQTQVYRNGMLQLLGEDVNTNNDVYFVSASGTIAFEYNVQTLDIVQVWKFTATTSG